MCLAERHKAVTPVRFEPAAPLSRDKHSTTEPLRSQSEDGDGDFVKCQIRLDIFYFNTNILPWAVKLNRQEVGWVVQTTFVSSPMCFTEGRTNLPREAIGPISNWTQLVQLLLERGRASISQETRLATSLISYSVSFPF